MALPLGGRRRAEATALPGWIKPQLLDRGAVRLLTRTGLDWTHKYPAIAAAVASLPARQAYLDGELCGIRPDGTTSFSLIQNASDTRSGEALVFFLFDLLHLDGEAIARCRWRSGKNAFVPYRRAQARCCNTAITRSVAAGPSTTMPAL